MKRLWAPWRMEYILGDRDQGCFLCRILDSDDDRGNLVLKRGRTCAVVMNRYPYNNGHLMVFPFRHVDDVVSLTTDERCETMDLVAETLQVLREAMCPQGFNVGINLGEAGGAGLAEHVHTHIVPRWEGDTNFMPAIGAVKIIPQSLLDLRERLYPLFERGQ